MIVYKIIIRMNIVLIWIIRVLMLIHQYINVIHLLKYHLNIVKNFQIVFTIKQLQNVLIYKYGHFMNQNN